jgi:hypothetical protein
MIHRSQAIVTAKHGNQPAFFRHTVVGFAKAPKRKAGIMQIFDQLP